MELLVREDGSVEQEVVLAVDTATRGGEDIGRYELRDGCELRAVHLRGDQAWWHQLPVAELLEVVEGRLRELTNQLSADGQLEGSGPVSGMQGFAGHGRPLNQTGSLTY
jgi:hypothetical protein